MSPKEVDRSPLAISIAIPTSFIDVYPNKAQRTQQIGRIARAVVIFQVDEIILYRDRLDKRQAKNLEFISRVLEYMETPQYLRKYLFGKIPDLQYAGLLPPLRTPHHPLAKKSTELRTGEVREGVTYLEKGKLVVDVGVETPIPIVQSKAIQLRQRITVQINRNRSGKLIATPHFSSRLDLYWGYAIRRLESSLGEFLTHRNKFEFIIATSRKGSPLQAYANSIRSNWRKSKRLLLLFGSYKEGLGEILQREKIDVVSVVNHLINLVLNQGTATIRTEEAVLIGLSAFRFLERQKD